MTQRPETASWRVRGLLALSFLGLLALRASSYVAFTTPEEQELLEWVIAEGAVLKATIGRTENGVRGLFATEDVKEGETIMEIPLHLGLSVKLVAAAESAVVLMKELHQPCSRLRPYLQTLPKENEVLTAYNWPLEYLPYIADTSIEGQIQDMFKRHMRTTFLGENDENMEMTIPEAIGRKNITLEHWEYVVSLLGSRTFSFRKNALTMMPVLDLVNHDARNVNKVNNSEKGCIRLVAGKDLARGEEVTITYGPMRSDELLLYYGILDTVTEPPRLFKVDHRKYKLYDQTDLEDDPLTGPAKAVAAEVVRIRGIMAAFEARLAELGPIPDTIPYVAQLLRDMHNQRRRALTAEEERLEEVLAQLPSDGAHSSRRDDEL